MMFNDNNTAKTSKADLELAQTEANNTATLQNATKYSDLLTTAAKNGVLGVADTVGSVMQTIKGSITDLLSLEGNLARLKFLDQESAKMKP